MAPHAYSLILGQMGGDGGMFWGIAMMAAIVVVSVLAIVGAVWLLSRGTGERGASGRAARGQESALQVLERRFAAGEIDADEYRERRSTLEDGTG